MCNFPECTFKESHVSFSSSLVNGLSCAELPQLVLSVLHHLFLSSGLLSCITHTSIHGNVLVLLVLLLFLSNHLDQIFLFFSFLPFPRSLFLLCGSSFALHVHNFIFLLPISFPYIASVFLILNIFSFLFLLVCTICQYFSLYYIFPHLL